MIDVFTLNHDLLIENISKGNWLQEGVSDGFDDYRSRYYGDLVYHGEKFNCRLEEYTGKYDTAIRLYKLHGSLDYILFKRPLSDGLTLVPDKFIKVPREIAITKIKRQRSSRIGYDYDQIEYHSDILTGTKTKQKFYGKFLYKKLFNRFKNELTHASKLIIIGYGGRDEGINRYLLSYYDFNNKPTYIFDPGYLTNKDLSSLGKKLNAVFFDKSISGFAL